MTLTPEQSLAVENAVRFPVSVLTGGPGTGKTFATTAILDALGRADCLILAPTGKAANRAREVTGHNASTIHRFVGRLEREQEAAKDDRPDADSPDYEDVEGPRCLIVDVPPRLPAPRTKAERLARQILAAHGKDGAVTVHLYSVVEMLEAAVRAGMEARR